MVLSLTKLEAAPPEGKNAYQQSALWAVKGQPLMLASLGSAGWMFMIRACSSNPMFDKQDRAPYEALCSQCFRTRRQALQAAEIAIMMMED